MEPAKTLIRTTVRTFFSDPKQTVIIDALFLHSVLHIEDLARILSSQPKEVRPLLSQLRSARLLSSESKLEARAGSTRGSPREYYYIPFHPAIDAIKYRNAHLRNKVESSYKQDETKRKDWQCPRCKAEYEALEIMDKIRDDGFFCEKCGNTLVQNETAAQDRGNHEKIRLLNTQLAPFDELIARIDREEVPENDFATAWERKREVPREEGSGFAKKVEYVEIKRDDKSGLAQKRQEVVDSKNLNISIQSGADRDRQMEEEKERRKQELAKQNLLPEWHTKSAIGLDNGVTLKKEPGANLSFAPVKKEEDAEEKKVDVEEANMQDEVAAYMAEMERERLERERQEQQENEDDDGDDDDDEGDFEDVGMSNVGTPMSTQGDVSNMKTGTRENGRIDGLKREFDDDASSVPSSDANTPASFLEHHQHANKRVKFEHAARSEPGVGLKTEEDADDSEEDEDFEDAM